MLKKILTFCILALALSETFALLIDYKYIPSTIHLVLGLCTTFLLFPKGKLQFNIKVYVITLCLFLIRASVLWAFAVFPLEDAEQVLLTLQMPLDGFTFMFVQNYCIRILLVGIILCIAINPLFHKITHKFIFLKCVALFAMVIIWNYFSLFGDIPLREYWHYIKENPADIQLHASPFWQQNFVDINKEEINADNPKNLIFIIMESMENFPEEFIPEIKELSQNNISFSKNGFGGGSDITGSISTITATVAKTTGVPYLGNQTVRDSIFFQPASIYDIFHKYNYTNYFLQGSDANFAGTKSFLYSHGIDSVFDINNLKNFQDIGRLNRFKSFSPKITDKKLFDIAREILDALQERNFSLTIATIETHYPYGLYNEQCKEKPESQSDEDFFKATLKCASRELNEFIKWCEQQSFFKNTVFVVVGDHYFGGKILIDNRSRKWIDIFINSSKLPITLDKDFTSFDIAPSILESMGFSWNSHRMGFGTSLFHDEETLLEKLGMKEFDILLKDSKYSIEYNRIITPQTNP
ncbi:MAG: LTA synthase family protein [Fibrobacter sp.]|nr:LTA synthase family protein [Fibrobacter sp.]